MQNRWSLLAVLFSSAILLGWSGGEPVGEKPVFFGTLTSHEGHTFNVTNITIGRSRDGGRSVRVYEMPKKKSNGQDRVVIAGNPYQDLTTTELDLLKVNKIVVPKPNVMWIWEKTSSDKRTPAVSYSFIELIVTWKDNQTIHYLLELGTENTTKPLKLFCDSTDDRPIAQISDQNKTVFCSGVRATELREKGAPFPAIKELSIEGHCYEPPKNDSAGELKQIAPPVQAAESSKKQ